MGMRFRQYILWHTEWGTLLVLLHYSALIFMSHFYEVYSMSYIAEYNKNFKLAAIMEEPPVCT